MPFNKNINGFRNEYEFSSYLNNKKVSELNIMFRNFIDDIFDNPDEDLDIKAYVNTTRKKYDICIVIDSSIKRISIKKGIKNSVHVEGISSFIHFLIQNGIRKEIIIEYLKYHYADGTTNGTGKERISVEDYKKNNQNKIDMINNAINNKSILYKAVKRFVLKGIENNEFIDCLLFGVVDDFIWIKKEDIVKLIMGKINEYSSAVHFGPLTVQPMNRCLNYNPKYEKTRFCVQIKRYNIVDDIIEYMNNKIVWYN